MGQIRGWLWQMSGGVQLRLYYEIIGNCIRLKLSHHACMQLCSKENQRKKKTIKETISNSPNISHLILEVIEHCFPHLALEFSSICMSATS